MDWHRRTDETHTHVTKDGFVVVLRRTRHVRPDGVEFVGDWTGTISRDNGAVMMSATEDARGAVIAACDAWLLALQVARERDPMPTT
jgi:hypothetical protein